jgi:hypothetical protein
MTRRCLLCLLGLAIGLAVGQELVQNGGFEDSLDCWTIEYLSPYGTWEVSAGPGHHPDPDYECYVSKDYGTYARARQTVDVSSCALLFTGSSKHQTIVGSASGYYAYATLTLEYRNSSGAVLGQTMFVQTTENCTLTNTATTHLITFDDTLWHDHEMLVDDEIATNLPGVDRGDVAKVSVALEANGNGRTG